MPRRPTPLLGWCVVALVTLVALAAACSTDSQTGESGTLQIDLTLDDGAEIEEVLYSVTGNGMAPMIGTIDVRAPNTTASLEIFGIPEGLGYLVEMQATTVDGKTTCKGSENFDISPGELTLVILNLHCKPPEERGGAAIMMGDTRYRQKRFQMFQDTNRSGSRSAPAMGGRKGFVKIQVQHIDADGPHVGNSHHCIHVYSLCSGHRSNRLCQGDTHPGSSIGCRCSGYGPGANSNARRDGDGGSCRTQHGCDE